ncbi:glycosyl hydrolase [Paenibacillus sp. LHD-38]|uniref:WD40/YVTN/BNR-like repeat-containing protein n=1 Tax=Paenibacillus sp. LHD-38 TaxID=3072143 RepID=UPI00280F3065|nr:glycosyl hydrolase [Paenibacillus sp. LHD-38]MDQ8733670.1 glycosyl hydrolase [Paenibacillus sp. LHD-38]
MNRFFLCMSEELIVLDELKTKYKLQSQSLVLNPVSIAIDPFMQNRLYCGTDGHGLWVSDDGGGSWKRIGEDIPESIFTSVFVSPIRKNGDYGKVYVGTDRSALFYSNDAGQSWSEWEAIKSLSSYSSWSFPPNPQTHNVRMIAEDPSNRNIYASIEVGAVIRTQNGGEHWLDTKEGNPLDAHTLLTHPKAPNRIYAACSDGVDQPGRSVLLSRDSGDTWVPFSDGLEHRYMLCMVISKDDPDMMLVSASAGARNAYDPSVAESYIYRKEKDQPWKRVEQGLPLAKGTMISNLADDPHDLNTFYALNNRGLYRSTDRGKTWTTLSIDWNKEHLQHAPQRRHRSALLVIDWRGE